MFKSKHSGWTWDLKRTPFGGGGGISNGFGIGDALASIDPGPAIGSGLASVDKAVNQVPGGWITVGGLAAGGLALAYAPEVMALVESTGMTPAAASTELGIAPINVATGEVVAPDVFAGLSASAPVDTAASQAAAASLAPTITSNPVTAEMVAAANASKDPIGMMGYLTSATPEELAAATGPGAGASSQLTDALKTANQVRQGASAANTLSKLLTQGAGSGLSNSLGQLAKGANPQGQALTSLVRGNTNPFAFTQQQPIRNATTPDLASLASLLKQG